MVQEKRGKSLQRSRPRLQPFSLSPCLANKADFRVGGWWRIGVGGPFLSTLCVDAAHFLPPHKTHMGSVLRPWWGGLA